ncbi:MAG TPA: DUF4062 domain-containing protein [Rhizomicrobium sp.]|nr:DUF4062 domain-containing protein [Rhizomicrobium sp.]
MAKNATILEVFVASPGDLTEERKLVEDVISEFNRMHGDSHNVRLELKTWENSVRPGFGKDPQEVINAQIGTDYDIFIGIMWARFGSPTGRAESGTAEEFERAYSRFRETNGAVQMMFYFKNAAISPNVDPVQLGKVQEFRQRISTEYGALYQQFLTPEDFERLLRIHLTTLVLGSMNSETTKFQPSRSSTKSNQTELVGGLADGDDFDDEGIIDLSERATDAMKKASQLIMHMNAAITELGDQIRSRTSELSDLKIYGKSTTNAPVIKRIANAVADDTELYAQRISVDLPALQREYSSAMEAFGKAAMMSGDDLKEPLEDLEKALSAFQDTRNTIFSVKEKVAALRDSIASTPRMTTAFNKARRHAVNATNDFLQFLENAENQSSGVETVLEKIIRTRRAE